MIVFIFNHRKGCHPCFAKLTGMVSTEQINETLYNVKKNIL